MTRESTTPDAPPDTTRASVAQYPQVSSTRLQNRFGLVMEELRASGALVIERHERPAAVLLTIEEFDRLRANAAPARQLDMLGAEFDALVAKLQTAKAVSGLNAAFSASPATLAKAGAPGIRASMPPSKSGRKRRA